MRKTTNMSGATTNVLLCNKVVSSSKTWTGRTCGTSKWSRSHGIDSALTISTSLIIIHSHRSGTHSNRNPKDLSKSRNRDRPPQSRPPSTRKHPVAPVKRRKRSERYISQIKNKGLKVGCSQSFILLWNKVINRIKSKTFTSLIHRCLSKIATRAII